MKKIVAYIVALIIVYSIYYDLTVGTLPSITVVSAELAVEHTSLPAIPFTLIKVKTGDTVISIVENFQQGPLPVPIDQVVQDFQDLNQNLKPEQIQIGNQYKIPLYIDSVH